MHFADHFPSAPALSAPALQRSRALITWPDIPMAMEGQKKQPGEATDG